LAEAGGENPGKARKGKNPAALRTGRDCGPQRRPYPKRGGKVPEPQQKKATSGPGLPKENGQRLAKKGQVHGEKREKASVEKRRAKKNQSEDVPQAQNQVLLCYARKRVKIKKRTAPPCWFEKRSKKKTSIRVTKKKKGGKSFCQKNDVLAGRKKKKGKREPRGKKNGQKKKTNKGEFTYKKEKGGRQASWASQGQERTVREKTGLETQNRGYRK